MTRLAELEPVLRDSGAALADIRDWLAQDPEAIVARSAFQQLLNKVPGLQAAYTGLAMLAEETGRSAAFTRVVHHTLRTVVYWASQSQAVDFDVASKDPRGLYHMTTGPRADFAAAMQCYLADLERIQAVAPGLLPYFLLWHDGFGLKAIGDRSSHQQRIFQFLNSLDILTLVRLDEMALQSDIDLPSFVRLAIQNPLLMDINYHYRPEQLSYYSWIFFEQAQALCPGILDADPLSFYLDFQLCFSCLDVAAIREPGRLSSDQVLGWAQRKQAIQERLDELSARHTRESAARIVATDLQTVDSRCRELLMLYYGEDRAQRLDAALASLPESTSAQLDRYLPRIISHGYFEGIYGLLIDNGEDALLIELLSALCKLIASQPAETWTQIDLDRDYVKISDDLSPDHSVLRELKRADGLTKLLESAHRGQVSANETTYLFRLTTIPVD